MRTIKLTMAIAAVALSSVICQAQPNGARGKHPVKHNKEANIAQKLGLNQEQANQLKVIHEKQIIENKAIQEKITLLKRELKALKEKKKVLNEVNMKEIEFLLTPEQFIKFKEMKKNKKENRKEKKQNH
jgi:Spy/CpxP family protein refolding chaperone